MKNYITEGDVDYLILRNIWKQDNFAINYSDKENKTLNMVVPKERHSPINTSFYSWYYGGEKITLFTKVKKGWGKGKPRKVVFFKRRNTFENLTWMEK